MRPKIKSFFPQCFANAIDFQILQNIPLISYLCLFTPSVIPSGKKHPKIVSANFTLVHIRNPNEI